MPGFGSAMNARPPGISFFCSLSVQPNLQTSWDGEGDML